MFANVLCGSKNGSSKCAPLSHFYVGYTACFTIHVASNTDGVNFADVRLSTKTFPSNQTVADK